MAEGWGEQGEIFIKSNVYAKDEERDKARINEFIVSKEKGGDTDSIEEALKMIDEGGIIRVLNGEYEVSSLSSIKNNTKIIGDGNAVLILGNSDGFSTKEKIEIERIKFKGTEGVYYYGTLNITGCKNIALINCEFEDLYIEFDELPETPTTEKISIKNCYFKDSSITFDLLTEGTCFVEGNLFEERAPEDSYIRIYNCNAIINGNTIIDETIYYIGISLTNANGTIEGNYIKCYDGISSVGVDSEMIIGTNNLDDCTNKIVGTLSKAGYDGKKEIIGTLNVTGDITGNNLSGTNTGDQDLSEYVPYTGATGNVTLGSHTITADQLKAGDTNNFTYVGDVLSSDYAGITFLTNDGGWKNAYMYLDGSQIMNIDLRDGINDMTFSLGDGKDGTLSIQGNVEIKKTLIGGTEGDLLVEGDTTLSKLTNNGFVKTSGGTGALSIDTNTYLTASDITGKANVELDNLSDVAINTDLISDTDNTDSLGTASKGWKDLQLRNQAYIGGVTSTATSWDISTKQVGHWKLNDNAANSNVVDYSGNSFTGTYTDSGGAINTSTGSQAGKIDKCLDFDGTDEYVTMGDILEFDYDDAFSFALWMKPVNSGATTGIITKVNPNSPYDGYVLVQRDDEQIRFYISDGTQGNGVETTTSVTPGSWVHLAVTYNGGNTGTTADFKIYFNGVAKGLDLIGGGILSSTITNNYPFAISSYGGANRFFQGQIEDVRAFDKVLTQAEIDGIYNSSSGTYSDSGSIGAVHQVIATSSNYTSSNGLDSLKDLAIEGDLEVDENAYLNGTSNVIIVPTSDPGVAGALWNNAGTLEVSSG